MSFKLCSPKPGRGDQGLHPFSPPYLLHPREPHFLLPALDIGVLGRLLFKEKTNSSKKNLENYPLGLTLPLNYSVGSWEESTGLFLLPWDHPASLSSNSVSSSRTHLWPQPDSSPTFSQSSISLFGPRTFSFHSAKPRMGLFFCWETASRLFPGVSWCLRLAWGEPL